MGRLIIDNTTIYEIDEECMRRKEQQEKAGKTGETETRNRSAAAETSRTPQRTFR